MICLSANARHALRRSQPRGINVRRVKKSIYVERATGE